MMVIAEMRRAC